MIAVAALALLTALVYLERPNGGNTGMLPVGIPPYVSTASPTATDITEDDTVKALKTSQRGGDNQQGKAPRVPEPARLDDPILVWLPEILAASRETGVPPALIAGVIRIESQGEPQAASPAGARGLMQVMPEHLVRRGVPEHQWHDPATNIMVGARLLGWNIETYGSQWDGVAHYFGIGCDGFNCTDAYVSDVLAWEAYYAPLIARP